MSAPATEEPDLEEQGARAAGKPVRARPVVRRSTAAQVRIPFDDETESRGRGTLRKLFYLIGILALAGVGVAGWQLREHWLARLTWLGAARGDGGGDAARFHTVARGDLRVVLTESGLLRSLKSHPIFPKIERQELTITWLAEEGASVKAGDLVASFDPKQFEEQLRTVQGELESARREVQVAEAAVEIEVSNGKSLIATAESKMEDAGVKLRTYIDLEAPKRLNEVDAQINELRQKVEEAEKLMAEAKAQLDDGLFNEETQRRQFEQQYKGAQENHRTLQRQHEAAKLQRKIFRAYEYPQTLNTREQEVENSEIDLAKARISAENGVNQKRAELARITERIARFERDEKRLQEWIENCDLHAPVNGLVVYGDGRNHYYPPGYLQVGARWYSNNPLMTIPDLSNFEIDVNVAEQYRGLITAGIPVTIRVQALPDLALSGVVKEISRMGQPRSPYDPTGPRAYKTVVTVESASDKLVSGMSAEVEILADQVRDVLLVPIDAVYNDGGQTVVFVREGPLTSKRLIEVGRRNLHMVEVLEGLVEGEQVTVGPAADLLELLKPGGVEPVPEAEAEVAAGTAAGAAPPQTPPGTPAVGR